MDPATIDLTTISYSSMICETIDFATIDPLKWFSNNGLRNNELCNNYPINNKTTRQ